MSTEDRLRRLGESIKGMPFNGFSERETERYLVEPFLDALGYDPRNPNEVKSQFPIKIGSTTRNCDFAVRAGGEVRILVEAKRSNASLDSPGQLASYFSQVPTALLGIYTNGLEYRFYAERNRGRVKQMDSDPFLVLDLRHHEQSAMIGASRCSKDHLRDVEGFQRWVTELGYSQVIYDRLRRELLSHPSDELVHLAMDWAEVEVRTAQEINRFRQFVKDAARRVLGNPTPPPVVDPVPPPVSEHTVSLGDVVEHINSWGRITGHEMRKRAPKMIVFPDDTQVPLKNWYNVVLETAYWLYQRQLLTTANCEIQDPGHADHYILSADGRHRDGSDFRYGGEPLRDTGIRMHKDLGAVRLMRNAICLLEHFGQDPSRVSLRFS